MFAHIPTQVKPAVYEFHPNAKEITRRKDVADAGKVLFGVLLNDARFRSGGESSRASNERLASETGWTERKVQRVLCDLERLGLIRRAFKASSQVQRDRIVIAWVPTPSVGTSNPSPLARHERRPGTSDPSPQNVMNVAPGTSPASCIKESGKKESERTGGRLSTLAPGGEGEDPKSTPAVEALDRAAIAAAIADGWRSAPSTGQLPTAAAPELPSLAETHAPPVGRPILPSWRTMKYGVTYAARAEIARTRSPRKTADQQMRELDDWSRRQAGHSPALVPRDAARAESLRNREPFGGMANLGKL